MIERDDFDLQVVAWLADDAGDEPPAYLGVVLGRIERTRQWPAWATFPGGIGWIGRFDVSRSPRRS